VRTTELVNCPRSAFSWLGPTGVRRVVIRWLRLVAADAELATYLVGLDRPRLSAQLGAQLAAVLDSPGAAAGRAVGRTWRRLGLTEEQHWRVLDYLAAVLCALDLPVDTVVAIRRAVAG
jgi:hemoglobin